MDFFLNDEEKILLLKAAREAIRTKLTKTKPKYPDPTPLLREKCGAFVTLHKAGKLRGCIGHIEAFDPLFNTVIEVARASAFSDPRFSPVKTDELGSLEIEISALSPLKRIHDLNEIKTGTHGIMLKQGNYSGLLLPQVAAEYGWDRRTFLTHTCQKAGLPGDCWKSRDTEIEIFSAIVFNERDFNL